MKRLILTAVLASLVGIASASTTPKPDVTTGKKTNECLFIRSVDHYQPIDRDKVVIWGPGRRDAYLAELTMPLFNLEGSWNIALIDHDRDGRLCGFSSDKISVRDGSMHESASLRAMTKLTEADLATLEEHYRVSLTKKKKTEKQDNQDN
jgi:hypothetical protein